MTRMETPHVLLMQELPFDGEQWRRLLDAVGEGAIVLPRSDRAALARALQSVEIAILADPVQDDHLRAPHLRWIHCNHAGLDHSASPALFDRGIALTSSAGRSAPALAEHALMFCLMLSSRYVSLLDAQRQHRWLSEGPPGARALFGRTLGIVGLGHTGQELALRAKSFGMRVLGYRRRDRPVPQGVDRIFAADRGDGLGPLLAESDLLVLALPLSDATRQLIGRAEFAQMKPGAILVNLARGGVVDQDALIEVLESGRLAGAGLDVTTPEPLPGDHRLWSVPNVLITPHFTAPIAEKSARSVDIILENLRRYRAGEPLLNRLQREDTYGGDPAPSAG